MTIPELGTITRHAPPDGLPHLERHARPVRGAQASCALPPYRLPDRRARARDPPGPRGGPDPGLAEQVSRVVRTIRDLDLKKAPSISESLDWARTLVLLGIDSISPDEAGDTLHVLLKYEADIEKARRRLAGLPSEAVVRPAPIDSFRQPETRER